MSNAVRRDSAALVAKLRRLANKADAEANRKRARAGHSHDDGTGDEGWAELFSLSGKADGLNLAASLLEKVLNKNLMKQGGK